MEEPHDHDDPEQLAIPLGSWFVMDVFNTVERKRYWIDGIKPIPALVWYALAYDFALAAHAISALAKALPGIITERIFDAEPPNAALVQMLEDPAKVDRMAARYQEDETFRSQFNAEVAKMLAPPPDLPGVDMAPMAIEPDPVAMGNLIRDRVRSSLYEIAANRAVEERVNLVIFGHTHDASLEDLPGGGVYANSGTWTWRVDFSDASDATWRDIFEHPERYTGDRLLSYIRVDYDEAGSPVATLMDYQPEEVPLQPPEPPPPSPPPEPVPPRPPEPPPSPAPAPSLSLWQRIVAWLRGLAG
jgi:hypothetical protein